MNITGRTRVYGILGDPVAHSLSPPMQNAAFDAAGLDAVYVPFHVASEDLGKAVAGLRALGVRGASVTVPHKEAVCAHLDRLSPLACRIAAVNTLVLEEGVLTGHNTDGLGFLHALGQDLSFEPSGKRILLLGAGGACRAALAALAEGGARSVAIANRTPSRALRLQEEFSPHYAGTTFADSTLDPDALHPLLDGIDLLVNTSTIGLKGDDFENFPWEGLPPATAVYDMVYVRDPRGTPFLQRARQRGHRAADGLGMLAGQGEEAFYLWTGRRPPAGVMKSRLEQELSSPG